jgi:hypothetical protein
MQTQKSSKTFESIRNQDHQEIQEHELFRKLSAIPTYRLVKSLMAIDLIRCTSTYTTKTKIGFSLNVSEGEGIGDQERTESEMALVK